MPTCDTGILSIPSNPSIHLPFEGRHLADDTGQWTGNPCKLLLYQTGCVLHHITVGNKNDNTQVITIYRFIQKTWDGMYTLSDPMVNTRAAVLNNQLLVYGMTQYDRRRGFTCAMVIFDQLNQEWIQVLEEVLGKDANSEKSTIAIQTGKAGRRKKSFFPPELFVRKRQKHPSK